MARIASGWPALVAAAAVLALLVMPTVSGFHVARTHGCLADLRPRLCGDAPFPVGGIRDTLPGSFPTSVLPGTFGFTW